MYALCIVQRRAFDPLKTRVRDDCKSLLQWWGLNLCSIPLAFARAIYCNFLDSLSQYLKTVSLGLTSWMCCSLCWVNLLKALEWARHHCSRHPMSWLPHTLLIPSKCLYVLVFSVMQSHPEGSPEETCLITWISLQVLCLVLWWQYPMYLELTDGKRRCPYLSQQENVDPSLNIWNILLTANKKS